MAVGCRDEAECRAGGAGYRCDRFEGLGGFRDQSVRVRTCFGVMQAKTSNDML